jgi:hypothetical protein
VHKNNIQKLYFAKCTLKIPHKVIKNTSPYGVWENGSGIIFGSKRNEITGELEEMD